MVELDRLVEDLDQALGDQLRRGLGGGGLEQDDELVAAESPDGVLLADRAAQPVGDHAQELVTGRVAEIVVDVLEAVDVDEQRGRAEAGSRAARASSCSARSNTGPGSAAR